MKKKESLKYKNGQTINNFTIISLDYQKIPPCRYLSEVLCNLCDNVVYIPTLQIKNYKSCGCRNYRNKKYSKKHIYYKYQYGAAVRELDWKIPYDYFCDITSKNCSYCGSIPTSIINDSTSNRTTGNLYTGLDRIDNKIGYILTNIVPCCKICNRAKNNMPHEEWLEYLNNLTIYRSKL